MCSNGGGKEFEKLLKGGFLNRGGGGGDLLKRGLIEDLRTLFSVYCRAGVELLDLF